MKRSGFTLIELLVTIVIIAALLAILLPVLRAGKQRAGTVACGSNLRQLALAMAVYSQEHRIFPYGLDNSPRSTIRPPGGYPGSAARDIQGWWWFHFLADSLGEDFGKGSVFWCPSRSVKDPYILCGNYGVNRSICRDAPGITGVIGSEFVGTPLGPDRITRPAQTLLVVDSGYSLISWLGAANTTGPPFENPQRQGAFYIPGLWINEQRTISPGCEQDAVNGRHPNKTVNVIFTDGHMSRIKADELFVEETGGSYINRSPLWLPK